MIPLIPIAAIIVALLLGIPLIYFTVAVFEVLKIVMVILLFPLLVKYLGDYLMHYMLDIDERISLAFGAIGSVIIVYVLYLNFYALVIGGIILYAMYIVGRMYIDKDPRLNKALSMTQWFKGGKR